MGDKRREGRTHNMVSRLIRTFAMLLLVGLAGCLKYEEHISFDSDGSGSVLARLSISTNQVNDVDSTLTSELVAVFSNAALTQHFQHDGISIQRTDRNITDSSVNIEVEYRFEDLEAFRRTRNSGRDVAVSYVGDGLIELSLVFPGIPEQGPETAREIRQILTSSRSDTSRADNVDSADTTTTDEPREPISATLTVQVPTQIVSAPGAHIGGDSVRVEWMGASGKASAPQPVTTRIIFKSTGLDWPTFETMPSHSNDVAPQLDAWEQDN
jgi:hypothetical protein